MLPVPWLFFNSHCLAHRLFHPTSDQVSLSPYMWPSLFHPSAFLSTQQPYCTLKTMYIRRMHSTSQPQTTCSPPRSVRETSEQFLPLFLSCPQVCNSCLCSIWHSSALIRSVHNDFGQVINDNTKNEFWGKWINLQERLWIVDTEGGHCTPRVDVTGEASASFQPHIWWNNCLNPDFWAKFYDTVMFVEKLESFRDMK